MKLNIQREENFFQIGVRRRGQRKESRRAHISNENQCFILGFLKILYFTLLFIFVMNVMNTLLDIFNWTFSPPF